MDFHEPFSSLTHLVWAGFLLFAGAVLLRLTRRHMPFRRWAVALYVFSAVQLYIASGLFHGVRYASDFQRELFRRFDLSGIFLLIAGSYLPVFAYLLTGRWRSGMTIAVLALAGLGIAAVWLFPAPDSGTMTPVYAALAAVGMLPVLLYLRAAGAWAVVWMLASAGVYAIGGLCEVFRWPVLVEGLIGPHEVLHVTDILGTLTHLGLVVRLVRWERSYHAPSISVGMHLSKRTPV
ncbi:MAG: hemolysin III family protein [Fimbriiglobus sp.]|jgi:channel protein (hemolysin III family)|nr:hemolysin III family protein [Fimbriiglobus sp.]